MQTARYMGYVEAIGVRRMERQRLYLNHYLIRKRIHSSIFVIIVE